MRGMPTGMMPSDKGTSPFVTILPANRIPGGGLVAFSPDEAWTVGYFGDDYEGWVRLCRGLPAAWSANAVGERLSRAAERFETEVINLDAVLLGAGANRIRWEASDLADRGPYLTPFTLNLGRCAVLLEMAATPGRHLIVVEDEGLALALWQAARDNGVAVGWCRPGGGLDRRGWIRRFAAGIPGLTLACALATRVRELCRTLGRLAVLRRLRRMRPAPLAALRCCDVLIMAWSDTRTFSADREKESDPFFGALPTLLRTAGHKVGYLANPLSWLEPFPAIAEVCTTARDPVLMLEDCLTVGDLLAAALGSLAPACPVGGRTSIDGLDVTALVRRELRLERMTARAAQAWYYLAVGRALRRFGLTPTAVLMSYENQPWEKLTREGLRRHRPATRVISCQISMFGPGYLSFFPSRMDVASGRLPDALLISGEHYADLFRRHGFPDDRLVMAGAIRYQGFLEHLTAMMSLERGRNSTETGMTVLCATSLEYQESLELVHKAAIAIAEMPGARLQVNFHPIFGEPLRQRLRAAIAELASAPIEYVTTGIQTLLATVDVVLYNSSGASFEALAAGVPVIYIGRDLVVDLDRVPKGAALHAQSPAALGACLASVAGSGRERTPATEVLSRCLAPIRPLAVLAALYRPTP